MALDTRDLSRPVAQQQISDDDWRHTNIKDAYSKAVEGAVASTVAAGGAGYGEALSTYLAAGEQPLSGYIGRAGRRFGGSLLGVVGAQALEQTVWKDKPMGYITELTDYVAPLAAGFLPGRALVKTGLVLAAHVGARAVDARLDGQKLF